MEPTGETSARENGNTKAKEDSVPETTTDSVSQTESTESESSDFDREYTCDVCEKSFSGLKPLKQHEKSGKHLKALRKKKLKKEIEEEEDSTDEDFSLDRNKIYAECEVCRKEFNGPESYRLHMRSKRHKKRAANNKMLEKAKEDGKINVDKLKQIMKIDSSAFEASVEPVSSESDGDTTSRVFECERCEKVFSGLEPFRDHMTSKTHQKTLKQTKMIQNLSSSDPDSTLEFADGDIVCKLCRMSFTGPENAKAHLKSKGHVERIEFKKWKKERRNSEKQESEPVIEASCSAESTKKSSFGDLELLEVSDANEVEKTTKAEEDIKNRSLSLQARISYKKYKELINESEAVE